MTHENNRQLLCTVSESTLPMQLLAIKPSFEQGGCVKEQNDLCRTFSL